MTKNEGLGWLRSKQFLPKMNEYSKLGMIETIQFNVWIRYGYAPNQHSQSGQISHNSGNIECFQYKRIVILFIGICTWA